MGKNLIIGIIILLAIAGGGYLYYTGALDQYIGGTQQESQGTSGASGDIEETVASLVSSAQEEVRLVVDDQSDLTMAEQQAMDISNTSNVYEQGDF